MQQFTVPQFIDTEDKIIGPLTVRQFVLMLFCFIWIGVFYRILDFTAFLTASILWFIIWFVIAFVRVNGRPFHFFILNLAQTFKKPGLRIWQQELGAHDEEIFKEIIQKDDYVVRYPEKLTTSRLKDLSLVVDTGGSYKIEEEFNINKNKKK